MEFQNKEQEALFEAYNSQTGKEYIELGKKIKELDKSTDKKMLFIKIISLLSMAVIGFFAFGNTGAIIFALIAFFAAFWLQLSSKKSVMLKYFTFYRTRIPRLIAQSQWVTVDMLEPNEDDKKFIGSLYEQYKLSFRMCHKYDELYIGFAKFMEKNEPRVQGVLYYLPKRNLSENNEGDVKELLADEIAKESFSDYIFKVGENGAILYLIGAEEYLNGRVEMKDDLTIEALNRQLDFYLLGKKLEQLSK